MSVVALYLLLLKATVTSFSGFGSVPLVRADLVLQRAVLNDEQLNNAIAIGQASPGPLGIYVVVVGYFVAGPAGALAGVLALATPALLAMPIFAAVRKGRDQEIRAACSGIVIVSCVLMLVAGMRLAPQATPTPPLLVVAAASFIVLAMTGVAPVVVIALSATVALFLP